ncbi:hypothetical protein IMZ48_25740 [Candidatus Bathyarchaeota archaeon]|nr:hypothetical protein [Candidatus Bathyarchaeota archaeon]
MKKGYQEPTDMSDCSMQHAYSTKDNFFEHLMANPPYGLQFNQHMGGYRQGRPSWMDAGFYPVQERLISGFDDAAPDAALLVDVGGGLGHDIDEFRRKNTEAPGRLVLQDLGAVLAQIEDLDPKIERLEYDFHTEQPIKGNTAPLTSP